MSKSPGPSHQTVPSNYLKLQLYFTLSASIEAKKLLIYSVGHGVGLKGKKTTSKQHGEAFTELFLNSRVVNRDKNKKIDYQTVTCFPPQFPV